MLERSFAYLFTPRAEGARSARTGPFNAAFAFEVGDVLVLVLYTLVLAWAIYHHRPWIDEAQAWLIARDDSMRDMLLRRLHYEGAPALWHLLLKLAIAVRLPYAGLNSFAGTFALLGMLVFLRFSPFPRAFRWLLPFTFYLQYQYAAIARPYVLFPLLLFTLCILYSVREPRPILFAVTAGLLVNINLHAGIITCVFALLYLGELRQNRTSASGELQGRVVIGTAVFLMFCVLSVFTAFPAPDAMVKPAATGKVKRPHSLLSRLIPPEQMPASAPPLDPPLNEVAVSQANLGPRSAASPTLTPTFTHRALHKLTETVQVAADVATFSVAESNVLSVLFLLTFALWLWSRGSLALALPWLITVPIAASIWIYDHHTGMFILALVAAAWISLETRVQVRGSRVISSAMGAVALLVLLLQIGWTSHAIDAERYHAYDPGKETETFLVRNYAGKRIDGFGFETVSVQPYANHNLFSNWDHSYLLWSNANPIDLRRTEALAQHPDVVVVADLTQQQDSLYNQWAEEAPAGFHPSAGMLRFWEEHGYRETHRFCGERYMRAGSDNSVCEVLFESDQNIGSQHTH